jgi:hypothetical protein
MDELFALKNGDVVCHMGLDHCVERIQRFEEGAHCLIRGYLEPDDGLSLIVSNVARRSASLCRLLDANLFPGDPPQTVEYSGCQYRRIRRLELRERRGPLLVERTMPVHLYEAADGQLLWALMERSGPTWLGGPSLTLASTMVLHA